MSHYNGVEWHRRSARWQAVVQYPGGLKKVIGSFQDESSAARAYDEVAEDELGPTAAKLNFPSTNSKGAQQAAAVAQQKSTTAKEKWVDKLLALGKGAFG